MGRLLLAGLVLATACGGDDDGGGGADAACAPPDRPAGVVYLNRGGATYTSGPESSVDDTSIVVPDQHTFAPHPHGEGNWTSLAACFRAGLSQFHIDVVEEDPGEVDHTEIVFSTTWIEPEVGSISAHSCSGYPRGSAFVFGDLFAEDDWQRECELALQQFGVVAAGLEHSYDCRDYMSFLRIGCEEKRWLDEAVGCGELDPRPCTCGDDQNSYQTMLATFGPACR